MLEVRLEGILRRSIALIAISRRQLTISVSFKQLGFHCAQPTKPLNSQAIAKPREMSAPVTSGILQAKTS